MWEVRSSSEIVKCTSAVSALVEWYLSYNLNYIRLARRCKCLIALMEKCMREFRIPGKQLLNDLGQVMDIVQNEPSLPIAIRCHCCGFSAK